VGWRRQDGPHRIARGPCHRCTGRKQMQFAPAILSRPQRRDASELSLLCVRSQHAVYSVGATDWKKTTVSFGHHRYLLPHSKHDGLCSGPFLPCRVFRARTLQLSCFPFRRWTRSGPHWSNVTKENSACVTATDAYDGREVT